MKHSILLIIALFVATISSAQIKKEDREWLNHIRHAHPRMFISSEDIPQIKEAAKTFRSEAFDAMKKRMFCLTKASYSKMNSQRQANPLATINTDTMQQMRR